MIEIHPAKPSDAAVLSELSRRTFIETFAEFNSPENMNIYLNEAFSEEKQLAEIEDRKRQIYIAWNTKEAIGFFHLFHDSADAAVKGDNPIELLRLYVVSAWHGKGVAEALMNHCLELCRQGGYKTLWLGVWESNFRAQTFYRKYSFIWVGQHIFKLGHDEQIDLIFAKDL